MEKRTSAAARFAAALALVGAVLVIVVVVGAAMDDDSSPREQRTEHPTKKQKQKQQTKAETYTVQTGDTLTAIAQKTNVPVAEIIRLNPEVDPQILRAGETLKLR
jgi:LysM repeat protein